MFRLIAVALPVAETLNSASGAAILNIVNFLAFKNYSFIEEISGSYVCRVCLEAVVGRYFTLVL